MWLETAWLGWNATGSVILTSVVSVMVGAGAVVKRRWSRLKVTPSSETTSTALTKLIAKPRLECSRVRDCVCEEVSNSDTTSYPGWMVAIDFSFYFFKLLILLYLPPQRADRQPIEVLVGDA